MARISDAPSDIECIPLNDAFYLGHSIIKNETSNKVHCSNLIFTVY